MEASSPDMPDILAAVSVLHRGEKDRARALLLVLWETHATAGGPQQLSTLAHFLADTETDAGAELEWDLRALEAATGSRDADDRDALPPVPGSFLPSLHLGVAEGYRRLGEFERARRHLLAASRRIDALPDDGYRNLIRGGLRRLQGLLATA